MLVCKFEPCLLALMQTEINLKYDQFLSGKGHFRKGSVVMEECKIETSSRKTHFGTDIIPVFHVVE